MNEPGPFTRLIADLRRLFLGARAWDEVVRSGAAEQAVDVITGWLGGEWSTAGEFAWRTFGSDKIKLRVEPPGGGEVRIRFELDANALSSLQLRRHGGRPQSWPEGTQVGSFQVSGDEALTASWLSGGVRGSLSEELGSADGEVIDGGVQFFADIGDGTLRYDDVGHARSVDWQSLVSSARTAVAILEEMVLAHDQIDQRLEERTWDADADVRLHAARLVLSRQTGPAPQRLTHLLLKTGDPALMALAAERIDGGLGVLEQLAREGTLEDAGRVDTQVRASAAVVLARRADADPTAVEAALDRLRRRLGTELVLAIFRSEHHPSLERAALDHLLKQAPSLDALAQLTLLDDLLPEVRKRATPEELTALLREWFQRAYGAQLVTLGDALNRAGQRAVLADRAAGLIEVLELPEERYWPRALRLAARITPPSAVSDESLQTLLGSDSSEVVRAALQLLSVFDRAELCERLFLFENRLTEDETLAVSGDLGNLGGPAARKHLRRLLHLGEPEVQLYAAMGLGQCGIIDDVEMLLSVESRRGPLGKEARLAIESIQARVGATGKGALSVMAAEGAGGELSVAVGGDGELAFADDDER